MFCEKCGKPLRDGAKFCTMCGAKVQPLSPEQATVSGLKETGYESRFEQPPIQQTGAAAPQVLMSIKDITFYNGGAAKFNPNSTGMLTLTTQGFEYKLFANSRATAAFGLIGAAVSKSMNKDKPPVLYPLSEIRFISEDKKMGMAACMVLHMKDGRQVCFTAGALKNKQVREMIGLAQRYLE